MKKTMIAFWASLALAIIGLGLYMRSRTIPAIGKANTEGDALKTPGIKKLSDGYSTTNAYTKQEKFHPDMKQDRADALAAQVFLLDKKKPKSVAAGGNLADIDAWARERRNILNELINSFYRYSDGEGKAVKMGESEIKQILIFEATFNGIYV